MIIVKNITVSFGGQLVFENISFSVQNKDRIGIVGPNGAGKSTLLKALFGEIEVDSGYIEHHAERVGYVSQDPDLEKEHDILSGGEKTRLMIERALKKRPTLLLLDEPTNHLDTSGVAWLESCIRDFTGAVIIVSHNRAFLDAVATRIFELDSTNTQFRQYVGNYSAYKVAHEQLISAARTAHAQHKKETRRLEERITLLRQRASLYADPAHGKRLHAAERILEREAKSNASVAIRDDRHLRAARFSGKSSHAKRILQCIDVSKRYGDRTVLRKVSLEIHGADRVLLVGENGSGKTTLLRIIADEVLPDTGHVRLGTNVRIGYFAQEHDHLNPKNTVLSELLDNVEKLSEGDARRILGRYLFTGRDVFKKVVTLSLGERARLAFAKLLHHKYELLLLDEPTNHLDLGTREVIEAGLTEYQGAMIVVSHDRYFIESQRFEVIYRLPR